MTPVISGEINAQSSAGQQFARGIAGETGTVAQHNADKRKPSVGKGCLIGLIVGVVYCILKLIFVGKV